MRLKLTSNTVIGGLSVIAIGIYLVVAVIRFFYPYELEWMEGAVAQNVDHITHGVALYQKPTLQNTNMPYTPGFYYAAVPFALIFGNGLHTIRAVSDLASLFTLFALFRLGKQYGNGSTPGLVAAGLYAAFYWLSGQWYDTGRIDSLFIALSIASFWTLLNSTGIGSAVAAGVLMALALMTKQTALFFAVPLFVGALFIDRRTALAFGVAFVVVVAILATIFQVTSHGWFSFYVLLPQHEIRWESVRDFFKVQLPLLLPVLILSGFGFQSMTRKMRLLIGALLVGGVVGSFVGYGHNGGTFNDLMPMHLALALTAAAGLPAIEVLTSRRLLMAAGVAVQLIVVYFDAGNALPTSTDRSDGKAVLAYMKTLPPDTVVLSHPWYAKETGLQWASEAGMYDVLASDTQASRDLKANLRTNFNEGKLNHILAFNPDGQGFLAMFLTPAEVQTYSKTIDPALANNVGFFPPTGLRVRPDVLLSRG